MCTSAVEISPRRRGFFFRLGGECWEVVGSGQKLAKHFFILQNDLLVKAGKVKLFFFLENLQGKLCCLMFVCMLLYNIFACTASSECKTKKRCTKMPRHFFNLSSIWVYMKRFPLNMGPQTVGPSPGSDW